MDYNTNTIVIIIINIIIFFALVTRTTQAEISLQFIKRTCTKEIKTRRGSVDAGIRRIAACLRFRIFHIRIANDLNLSHLEWANIIWRYTNRVPTADSIFYGDYNVWIICYRLRDICRYLNDLDLRIGQGNIQHANRKPK